MLTAHAATRTATSILIIAGSENRLKNRPQSMDETQARSPKFCFSPDSSLVYGIRRDSRMTKIGGTCLGEPAGIPAAFSGRRRQPAQ
jgi:hypothetical protein